MADDELTEKQREVIGYLPASSEDISNQLGILPSSVRDRIGAIREKGIDIGYDATGGVYYLQDEEQTRRISTKHKGTITREANEWATEQEATILRRLEGKEPLVAAPDTNSGNEDMVIHFTDLHIGDVVEDERGREVYNSDIAVESVQHVTEKALELKQKMEPVTGFDTCHLLWGGDMITNECIYDGQSWDVEDMLADQMSTAVDSLTQQAISLAEEFDTLKIVSVVGNHGEVRASGVSKQANMDLILYRWVKDRLAARGYDNVHFKDAEATAFRNFKLRNGVHRGHLRHGQKAAVHADSTAASSRDWRGWWMKHQFDVALRGHYHEARYEEVLNQYPVIMSPSPKPGDDFVEELGSPDVSEYRKMATVFGCSDKRPVTWKFVVDSQDAQTPM